MNPEIIRTTTTDGLILRGLISRPSGPTNTCIVHIHGMSGNTLYNSFYPAIHRKFTENGFALIAGENRGANSISVFDRTDGSISIIGNSFEIFEESAYDIDSWVQTAKAAGYSRIMLQGHSLGCSKVAYYLATQSDSSIVSAILLSPADMLGLVEEPSTLPLHKRLLSEANSRADRELLSEPLWGYALLSAKSYRHFFGPESKAAIFNYYNSSHGYATLNAIQIPVLALTGSKDDGIAPACEPLRAMNILKAALKNSPRVVTNSYTGADHDFTGFGERLADEVISFCNSL